MGSFQIKIFEFCHYAGHVAGSVIFNSVLWNKLLLLISLSLTLITPNNSQNARNIKINVYSQYSYADLENEATLRSSDSNSVECVQYKNLIFQKMSNKMDKIKLEFKLIEFNW